MTRVRVSLRLAACLWALLLQLLSPSVLALVYNGSFFGDRGSFLDSGDYLLPRQNADKPFTLRIMPLGASITAGYGTTPQNGYRKPLRDQLRWRGWPVNMVGSLKDGDPNTFHNRQHEGHNGFVVGQMIGVSNLTIPRKPNVVLINCGTNDADPGLMQDIPNTPVRMGRLLDHLFGSIDGVTIILSTLLPRKDSYNSNVDIINPGYRSLVQQYAAAGQKIVLAEFNDGFLDTNTDYFDNLHPNEKGAAKLAAVWDQAILEAENKNFLTPPIDTGRPDVSTGDDDRTCDVELGAGRGPVKTQQGSGLDDGPYIHAEKELGSIKTSNVPILGPLDEYNQVFFAQIVNLGGADPGGEFDEMILCADFAPGETPGGCSMFLNDGGDFTKHPPVGSLDLGLKCLVRGIRWGDVNGDGLDDFICLNLQGNMYVAINQGGNPPTFKPTGNGGLIRTGESWVTQSQVRLGDMDGDGRLDYCAIDNKGDIYCWRNGGVGLAPTEEEGGYWQGLVGGEPTFYHQGEAEGIPGVHLVDINGDGRSDWVYVYNSGASKIFTNQRGDYDADGKGLRPHWTRATAEHSALDGISGKGNIFFGRLSGTGRADRIVITWPDEDVPPLDMDLYQNQGAGNTRVKGDGVYYCDMFGRGRDDYLWVRSNGEITLYENILSPPNWGQHGVIININRDRKSIHFGDWDGDGLCDILAVERHTGRVEWWRNTYQQGSASPTFDSPKWAVDSGSNLCTEGWGRGVYDLGLRFGDLDGDKRVDYLCMEKNARTVGKLNKPGGLEDKGQIKFAPVEKLDRANFHWADVTGDGNVDLLWVDKFDAKARLWKNGGFTPSGGSSMFWDDQGIRFEGHGRGANIHFPMLGDNGRADYHDVYPGTCVANTWFNECSGSSGEGEDDYPVPIDPGLPVPPGGGNGGEPPATTSINLPQPTVTGTFDGLIEKELAPIWLDEVFTYDLDDGSDRWVEVSLLGAPEDFPNVDCGLHLVNGEDGDTLSCVAESIAWLFYSLNELGGPEATNPDSTRRDASSLARRTQFHNGWKPKGSCTTARCMLMAKAPLNTWVPAGNGTSSNGVFHDLHFANFGSAVGYRAYAGGFDNSSSDAGTSSTKKLEQRQYTEHTAYWQADYYDRAQKPLGRLPAWYNRGSSTELDVSDKIGSYVENTVAKTDVHNLCIGLGDEVDNEPAYGYVRMGPTGSLTPTPGEVGGYLDDCDNTMQNPSAPAIVCYSNLTGVDPSLLVDEDDNDDVDYGPLPWQGDRPSMRFLSFLSLFRRGILLPRPATSGPSETYTVLNVNNQQQELDFITPTYPNGGNGEDLNDEKANGDRRAYALSNPGQCLDGNVTDMANTQNPQNPNYVRVVTEHIVPERQNDRNFLMYIQNPRMNLLDGNGEQLSNIAPVSFDTLQRYASIPYSSWANTPGLLPQGYPITDLPPYGSFFTDYADGGGSSSNPTVLTNLEESLNAYKARIMNTAQDPTSDTIFNPLAQDPTIQNTQEALSLLRLGFGVFEYLNSPNVLSLAQASYEHRLASAEQFDFLFNLADPPTPATTAQHLPVFHRALATRIQNRHRQYMTQRLQELQDPWTNIINTSRMPSGVQANAQQLQDARRAVDLIVDMRGRINTVVRWSANSYIP